MEQIKFSEKLCGKYIWKCNNYKQLVWSSSVENNGH